MTPNQTLLPRYQALARDEDLRALETLGSDAPLSPAAVHELRLITKRLRAYWRLMQPFCGRKNARNADRNLRDCARHLAAARDRHVMRKTLSRLQSTTGRHYEQEALETVAQTLYESDEYTPAPSPERLLLEGFQQDLERWRALSLDVDDDRLIREGLTRTYRKARALGFEALTGEAPEPWHQFRKWAKHLFYQLEPLSAAFTREGLHPEDLNKLGKKLGKLHDLHLLLEDIHRRERARADREIMAMAVQVIRRQEAELLEECRKGARNCLATKPGAFRQRVLDSLAARANG